MNAPTHRCPTCGSVDVWMDATVDAVYNPNTQEGDIPTFDIQLDNENCFIRCADCDATTDHADEWMVTT